MTTFELELEHDKRVKIAEAAARGAATAAEFGVDPASVGSLLTHYFRHVDPLDIDDRSAEDLLGLVRSHYALARQRPPARATIAILTPTSATEGWSASGATVVQIVTDDRPFLVDSVTMEVTRQGWSIRDILHPQFRVQRDLEGRLRGVLDGDRDSDDPSAVAESWMHLEVLPPARPDPATLVADLEHGLLEVLRLVEDVVQDWTKMTARAEETADQLAAAAGTDGHTGEATLATEFLRWLVDHHFTFLGYRQYACGDGGEFRPVPGTGLGILRADRDPPDAFSARPLGDGPHRLLVITKDNHQSRVHRPAYLDYLGVRIFGPDGAVIGERRFLGLFATSAYSEPVARVPVVRQKAAEVLRRSGYDPHSHGGKAILDVLESYPRDELFQAETSELAATVEKIAHLKERRQVRVFLRRDPYGRYVSCLVYLPRDRYTTAVRNRMQDILLAALGGATIDYTARVSESVLARLHFVVRVPAGESVGALDIRALERDLTVATRSWNDDFADLLASEETRLAAPESPEELAALVGALPEGYKEDFTPRQAISDLAALRSLASDSEMSLALYVPEDRRDEAHLRLKIFRRAASLSLSQVLPHLSRLGVDVIDERPYELQLGDGQRAYIYDFGLRVPAGAEAVGRDWSEPARERFLEAFSASYEGRSESDGFNALVLGAGLTWREVEVLRAVGRYLRQAGSLYSQTYLAAALAANVDLARTLISLFEARFDPELGLEAVARQERVRQLSEQITAALADVPSLDHDRILRSYRAVLEATVRTNAFQPGREALALKLLPRTLPGLPEPRPAYEIFVYSPRLEGVHLRFGPVARGGLRWSDRAEDFRTEILGLVKAQMVKNAVIVPVGAKGGFYAKRLPDPSTDREGWLAEGEACYRLFVSSLLDVTDNLVGGQVVPPPDLVRYDGNDAYLVVAADKGTATFSDLANSVSLARGFWLGDAFASGGSAGYDHKAMGITARGTWESVRRHFREMGADCQTTDFTCVGIGDMSGDVFGNGMLQSRHTKLVAAFDHRHVFVDPDPDPAASFAERARLFAKPRSSWADYDRSLLSPGGGVFPRSAKSVSITEQMRGVLGLGREVTALSPAELITACLKAPVDLLFNGGVGTYVKATAESHAEAGDKANDALRVNGAELRARCVGEGGNLGFTQLGRVEYATNGGRINTDFLDNSAGVDTSDHEVNIKILLAAEVAAGRLTRPERDALLATMTDEVAESVLANNDGQNLALANSVHQAAAMARVHEDWMARLEDQGLLDRRLEFLPTTEELEARRTAHRGLTSPELAVLLAYTKIVLDADVLPSDLPDEPYLARELVGYFPSALRRTYADQMAKHPLHREIISTVVVNRFVNRAGITCFHRLSGETGAPAAEIIRAHLIARAIFGAADLDATIGTLDGRVDAEVQTGLRLEVRTLVERATRWLINNRRRPLDIAAAIESLSAGVRQVQGALPELLPGQEREAYDRRRRGYESSGVPEEVARAVAVLPAAYAALPIVQTAVSSGWPVDLVARTHLALGHQLGLDRLLSRIGALPREDRWQTMARAALRDDLHGIHAQLTAAVLADGSDRSAEEAVSAWLTATPAAREAVQNLRSICAGRPDLARMSVGLRLVRALLPSPA